MIEAFCKVSLERSVLGFLMVSYEYAEKSVKAEIDTAIHKDLFFSDSNKRLFIEIEKRKSEGFGFDMLSITEALEGESWYKRAGGFSWVAEICNENKYTLFASNHLEDLKYAYLQRESYKHLTGVIETLKSSMSHSEKMQVVSESMASVSAMMTDTKVVPRDTMTVLDEILSEIEYRINNGGEGGLHFGIEAIDLALGERGACGGDFIVVGARPKTGKTLMSLGMASGVCSKGKKVLFFSLEMKNKELVIRLMSTVSRMSPSEIYRKDIADNDDFWANFGAASAIVKEFKLHMEDTPELKIQQIKAISHQFAAQHNGVDMIIVDYLQKCGVNNHSRHDLAIGEISGGLKNLAKELNTVVVALSQLNRAGTGKPTISHLRESGQIEQDADAIFLMHNLGEDNEGNPSNTIVEVNMPAYRHGQSAGPFYVDKMFGRIKDADNFKVQGILSEQSSREKERQQKNQGFKPSFGNG